MITSLEDQLRRDEEEVLHAYFDSLGFITIGVGHLIDSRRGGQIPPEISLALLRIDISAAETFVDSNFPWAQTLDPVRREVLVNMAFNMKEHLLEFHDFLAQLQANNFTAAAAAMLDSLWAKQVGDRAKRLSVQIQTGVRQ